MASTSAAVQLATRFVPSASLSNAPEDILVQILAFVSPLDVLSIRRCCRRLYHISNTRVVWIDALRKIYSRRALPPLCPPSVTSQLPTAFIEHRTTRPLRFLHALADIGSARVEDTTIEVEEEVAPPAIEDESRWKSGVIGLHLIPGGRWLCLLINTKAYDGQVSRGVLIIIDLWRDRTVVRHAFNDSAHWNHVTLDESGSSIAVVVGFDKTRLTDPYFAAYRVAMSQLDSEDAVVERVSSIKVERTPRSCTIFGKVVAFVDRIGSVTFWDWDAQSSATMAIHGWPPSKGKIMMMSNDYFASFNPASSAFAIHKVPQLLPLGGIPDAVPPVEVPEEGEEDAQPPVLHALPPVGDPSTGVKRFRLPSRNLQVTLPERIPASSFYQDNSQFPDPFLAYFLVSHPDNMSEIYMGLIPEITPDDDSEDIIESDAGGDGEDDSGQDSEESQPNIPVPAALQHLQHQHLAQQQAQPPPQQQQQQQVPGQLGPQGANGGNQPAEGQPAPQQAQPIPQGPEPEWLCTLRCVDTSTNSTFSREGKILWCSSLDHSVAVLRSSDEGYLELFTTSALHSKPATAQPTPRAISRHHHNQQHSYHYHGYMHPRLYNFAYPPPTGLHGMQGVPLSRLPRYFAPPPQWDVFHPRPPAIGAPWPYPATADALSLLANVGGPGPSSNRVRSVEINFSFASESPRKRPRLAGVSPERSSGTSSPGAGPSSSSRATSVPSASLPSPPPRSYTSPANPHPRIGLYAEGDHQVISYRPQGEVWAATVDDVSGKIALVVENYEQVNIVMLDYGWDFWKPEANEERAWRVEPDDFSDVDEAVDRARTLSRPS